MSGLTAEVALQEKHSGLDAGDKKKSVWRSERSIKQDSTPAPPAAAAAAAAAEAEAEAEAETTPEPPPNGGYGW
ncbi:hypothetical protein LTR28_013514, partial [Elasticomyces elasticus]